MHTCKETILMTTFIQKRLRLLPFTFLLMILQVNARPPKGTDLLQKLNVQQVRDLFAYIQKQEK